MYKRARPASPLMHRLPSMLSPALSRSTKHYMYETDACRLRRLSSLETRACLEGSRLVFLGDSVTRYQVGGGSDVGLPERWGPA